MESIPDLRKLGTKILTEKGFVYPVQEDSSLFVYKELEVNRVCFHFSLKHTVGGINYSAKCTFVSNELGKAINFVTGKKHYVFPTSNCCTLSWRERFDTIDSFNAIIENHSSEAIKYATTMSFNDGITDLLSTLNRPGSHQLWHIAALACTKDKDAINELLNKINSPQKGGLFPYIKQNYLELALVYVESNT